MEFPLVSISPPPPPPPPPPAPPPPPSPQPDYSLHRYWRDGQPDLYGDAAFAAATTDWGGGGAGGRGSNRGLMYDDERRTAPTMLLVAQDSLREVIKRAKQIKVDMYAGMYTRVNPQSFVSLWITPLNSLIMDALDDLNQGIDAIFKIHYDLEEACNEWEESDSDDDTSSDEGTVV